MRIIETFICQMPVSNIYVKVHRGRNASSNNVYIVEWQDGRLEEISDIYFESIKF